VNGYREMLAPYFRLGLHDGIVQLQEVIVGATCVYAFFARHYGDLHSHIRASRRLRDTDAAQLFEQIASVVVHCHESGVVLRDLKLRKFVFKDPEKLASSIYIKLPCLSVCVCACVSVCLADF